MAVALPVTIIPPFAERTKAARSISLALSSSRPLPATCRCGAGYRRAEPVSQTGEMEQFHGEVCGQMLETLEAPKKVAYRLTVMPGTASPLRGATGGTVGASIDILRYSGSGRQPFRQYV